MKMILLFLLTAHLTTIKLDRFNTLHRWYFVNDKAYILTTDYVMELRFDGDTTLIDTIVPQQGMKNLVFRVDTYNFYQKKDGLYLNNKKILSKITIYDFATCSNVVGILSKKTVYLFHLITQKMDTVKLRRNFLSITLTDTGFYLLSPDLSVILYYNLTTNRCITMDPSPLYKYLPARGIKKKGRKAFLRGGITGSYPYRNGDINTMFWGLYYDIFNGKSDIFSSVPRTLLLLTKVDTSGKITVKKCIRFTTPVYPIMITREKIYLAEFDFEQDKKEIKIWKASL